MERALRADSLANAVGAPPAAGRSMAHDREELRETDAHIRLGFDDDAMRAWFAGAGLVLDHVEHLVGGELTVALWRGAKSEQRQRERRAA